MVPSSGGGAGVRRGRAVRPCQGEARPGAAAHGGPGPVLCGARGPGGHAQVSFFPVIYIFLYKYYFVRFLSKFIVVFIISNADYSMS